MRRKRRVRARKVRDPLGAKKKAFNDDFALRDERARRRMRETETACKRVLAEGVEDPEVYDRRSGAPADLGRFDEAEEYCRNGLAGFPEYRGFYDITGLIRRRTGRPAAAIPYYDEAMRCYKKIKGDERDPALICNNKGVAYSDLKRREDALECYEIAIRVNPDYERARYNEYLTLNSLSRGDEADASMKEQFKRYDDPSEMLYEYSRCRADAKTANAWIEKEARRRAQASRSG